MEKENQEEKKASEQLEEKKATEQIEEVKLEEKSAEPQISASLMLKEQRGRLVRVEPVRTQRRPRGVRVSSAASQIARPTKRSHIST